MGVLGFNYHRRFDIHQIEKLDYVRIAHSNAAVASRFSDPVLVVGSMNVNVSLIGIAVVRVHPVEPENPRHDQIAPGRQFLLHLGWLAALKHRPDRQAAADFFGDAKPAGGRFHASLFHTQTKS